MTRSGLTIPNQDSLRRTAKPIHNGGGSDGFLHHGNIPENESAADVTKEIKNELMTIAFKLFLTKLAPACRPASMLSCGVVLPEPAMAPLTAPPTMQIPKYTTTNKKKNNTTKVATRFSSVIK